MFNASTIEKVDYLVIGHITIDRTPEGPRIGGTAAYASLTANALGLRVGIVTSCATNTPLDPLSQIQVINYPTESSTIFENIYTEDGRIQYLHRVASSLDYFVIPETWRNTPIVHLGPVAQEVEPSIVRHFPDSLIGLTPQGWLRSWNSEHRVIHVEWPESAYTLNQSGAAVISVEDVDYQEERIEELAAQCRILAVTEAHQGSRLYWNGDVRRFRPPDVVEVDPTGAGDIYAAAFFARLYSTRDPWESARFATLLSAYSVTRSGLEGSISTPEEIENSKVEVLK